MIKITKVKVDKRTEDAILDYMRKNVYNKYPRSAISKISLWERITTYQNPIYQDITGGSGAVSYKYSSGTETTFYYNDKEIFKTRHAVKITAHIKGGKKKCRK